MSSEDGQQGNRPKLVIQADIGDERYRQLAEREVIHVPRRRMGVALVAAGWAVLGIVLLATTSPLPRVVLWARSQLWKAVPCQVDSATIRPVEGELGVGKGYGPSLNYTYQVGNETYTGTRWRPGEPIFWESYSKSPRTSSSKAARRLTELKVCYVDPKDPTQSLLERTFPLVAAVEIGLLLLLSVVPGLMGFLWGVRSR